MAVSLASSSRLTLSAFSLSPSLIAVRTKFTDGRARYVKRPPPRPKMPRTKSPHSTAEPLPSSGASQPQPPHLGEFIQTTSSVQLSDRPELRIHHSPPSTAPNYTSGQVPDLLKWLGGTSVKLTGEEALPLRKERKGSAGHVVKTWTAEQIAEFQRLRAEGLTCKEIANESGMPEIQAKFISYVAPETPAAKARRLARATAKMNNWGEKKRFAKAVKERRREFW